MYRSITPAIVLSLVPMLAEVAQPDMQPGEWEYTTTTRISGPVGMPDRTSNRTRCVTARDVDDADTFMEDVEDRDVERRGISADRAGLALICPGQQGREMRMSMDMRLPGDRVGGESVTTLSMNGESMEMRMRVEGRRVGDC